MSFVLRVLQIVIGVILLLGVFYFLLSVRPTPETITYGMSFNTLYARELGLDWRKTYDAILNDLGVRHLRLAAHWPMIEPQDDQFNFSELDYQMLEAKRHGADVILAVGRRLPRWPECHVPDWARELSWEEQKKEIAEQIAKVVNRYKDNENVIYWQVENEPFLTVFAREHCGDLDRKFLEEEVALVRSLDPDTPVLVTDSGNLGTWRGAHELGDAFGTSVYVHFWNPDIGTFRSVLPPSFYRVKSSLVELFSGEQKPILLVELSAEPWLLQPVVETSVEIQLGRMDIVKFEDILRFAHDTRIDQQYLWGAEWWYWVREQGYSAFWERGKKLFEKNSRGY